MTNEVLPGPQNRPGENRRDNCTRVKPKSSNSTSEPERSPRVEGEEMGPGSVPVAPGLSLATPAPEGSRPASRHPRAPRSGQPAGSIHKEEPERAPGRQQRDGDLPPYTRCSRHTPCPARPAQPKAPDAEKETDARQGELEGQQPAAGFKTVRISCHGEKRESICIYLQINKAKKLS